MKAILKFRAHNTDKNSNSTEMPLIGWHSQFGDLEHEGKKYQVSISGGCQDIWLQERESATNIGVSIHIADILIYFIAEIERLKKENKS